MTAPLTSHADLPIVFIDDAHTFGGAQIAMAWAIRTLLRNTSYRLVCITTQKTKEAVEEIAGENSRLKFIECPGALPLNIISFPLRLPTFLKILRNLQRSGVRSWWLNLSGIEFCIAPLLVLKWLGEFPNAWLHNTERFSVLIRKPSKARGMLNRIRDWIADRWVFNLYPTIITPSRSTVADTEPRLCGIHRPLLGHLYYPPIGERRISPVAQAGSSDSRVLLWMIGRLEYGHKNNLLALELLEMLTSLGISATLTVVGDGPDFVDFKSRTAVPSLRDKVEFLGWKKDPWSTIPSNAIVIIPSFYESMCIVAREAMVRGILLVASPIPVFHEWIPSLLITDDISAKSFMQKILETQSLTQEQLISHYETALARFSDRIFVDNFEAYMDGRNWKSVSISK